MIVVVGTTAAVVVIAMIVAIRVLAPNAAPTPNPTPTFDTGALSIDDPNSYWMIADKLHALDPADWEPPDLVEVPVAHTNQPFLRRVASDAAVAMFAAFASESGGLQMQSQSAYRSYSTQESVYAGWVSRLGQAGADLTSTRPQYSEHQTGLLIDVSASPANCTLGQCFADIPQGQWLASEAWRFGFVLRYPDGKCDVTGYEFKPWHMRYVGAELATELHTTGVQTLEEFFGRLAAPDYAG